MWEARLQELGSGGTASKDHPPPGAWRPLDQGVLADATNTPANDAAPKQDVAMNDAGVVFEVVDYAPDWDTPLGGAKLLLTVQEGEGSSRRRKPLFVQFADQEVPVTILSPGVLRCFAPPHAPGMVSLCLTYGDGRPRSQQLAFEYREAQGGGGAMVACVGGTVCGMCALIGRHLCVVELIKFTTPLPACSDSLSKCVCSPACSDSLSVCVCS